MKIKLENTEYELDINKAIEQKLLVPVKKKITSFVVGDVFASDKHCQIIVVRVIRMSEDLSSKDRYGFLGQNGFADTYINLDNKVRSWREVVDYINNNNLEYKGNVNDKLREVLKELCGDQYFGM